MHGAWQDILGKTIQAVVTAERDGINPPGPKVQMFLVFSDGTAFEVYSSYFRGASGLDGGGIDAAVRYVSGGESKVQVIEE